MAAPSNHDVARVFDEMAELLAIRGGDPHRVRAFQRVAKVIENLPQPVARALRYGTLQRTPGIGEGAVHRVKQILRRGTCDDLERLRAQIPAGLREMTRLRGLGARTVRRLHQQLGIASIDQLELAATSGLLLKRMPRMGAERIHAILQEIAVHRARGGKIPLVEALEIAAPLLEHLRQAGAEQVAMGGSVRRRRAMIGDLDLLASAADPAPVIEAFLAAPGAESVISRRSDGGSIRLPNLRQVDLWVFPPESWGAGLHAFTGNKEHNVNLRTRAGRLGIHLSEHGISERDGGRRISTGRSEEEIYAAVGLPFIPVELRENLGEIEAAEAGRLPDLVGAGDLRGDLHMHTTWSDGTAGARDMVLAARRLGLEYVAITDHSLSLTVANGLDATRLREQRRELRRLQEEVAGIEILAGIEVDVLAGGALDLEASDLRPLDWVVASIHSDFDLDAEAMTSRLVRAMETGLVDCIGHPAGRKLGKREPYPLDLERLFTTARRLGVALEVNGGPRRMDLDDAACRQAREMGVTLVLNTDAHAPAHLHHHRRFALAMARRGWVERRHVLNARPVEEVRAWRRDRLRRHGIAV
ncbi:MAG: DNA polymerase/3'-5' exonuclease PolX, partial [Acidobacteria bacterium]